MSQELTILNVIVYIFFSAVAMYTYHKFFIIMGAKPRVRKQALCLVYAIFVAISGIAYFAINNNILNLSIGVIALFLILYGYRTDNVKRLFFCVFLTVISMVIELLVGNTVCVLYGKNISEVLSNHNLSFICYAVSKLLFFIAIQFYGYICKDKYSNQYVVILKQFSWQIAVLPIISIFLIYIMLLFSETSKISSTFYLSAGVIFIVLINILVFNLYDKIIEASKNETENIILNNQIVYYFDLYKKIEEEQKQVAKLKHNMKNDIVSINASLSEKNLDEAQVKTEKLLGSIPSTKLYVSNVPIINAILQYKISQSERYNIHINYAVNIEKELAITDSDMANILGNLLDNSIEASKNLQKEKVIDLNIQQDNDNLYINISNNYSGDLKLVDGIPASFKAGQFHGIGLKTIKNIAEKYDGMVSIKAENNIFEIEIIMFSAFK